MTPRYFAQHACPLDCVLGLGIEVSKELDFRNTMLLVFFSLGPSNLVTDRILKLAWNSINYCGDGANSHPIQFSVTPRLSSKTVREYRSPIRYPILSYPLTSNRHNHCDK